MSKNKHCGNCARFFNEDARGNGFCSISPNRQVVTCRYNTCIAHEWKLPKWTEITPENVDEIKSIESNRVIICASNGIGYMYPLKLLSLECSLESIADYGGHYYFVLPELKIE